MKVKGEKGARAEDDVEGGLRVYDPGTSFSWQPSRVARRRPGKLTFRALGLRIQQHGGHLEQDNLHRWREGYSSVPVSPVAPEPVSRGTQLTFASAGVCPEIQWVSDRAARREELLPRDLVPPPLR